MKREITLLTLLLILSLALCGCTRMADRMENITVSPAACTLELGPPLSFRLDEKTYILLDETISRSRMGERKAYLRCLLTVDAQGHASEALTLAQLREGAEKIDERALSFTYVYRDTENARDLLVAVGGTLYRAIPKEAYGEEPLFSPQNALRWVAEEE